MVDISQTLLKKTLILFLEIVEVGLFLEDGLKSFESAEALQITC